MRGNRRIISDTAGASVGRVIAVSFTIPQARSQMVSRGANARNLAGGNRKSGPVPTFLTSSRTNLPIVDRTGAKPGLKANQTDYVCIVSLRAAIEARALVSRRIRPMNLNGKTVHQIAVPFHFGAAGPLRGNAANNLVAISGEPNVTIMESKALLCNIIPGRLPRGPDFLAWIERYAPQSGQPPNLHPEQPPPGAPSGGKFSRSHGKEGKTG